MFPGGVVVLAALSLAAAIASALSITVHLLNGHRQQMWVMNIVWPVTALWAGPFALWAYRRYGRAGAQYEFLRASEQGETPPNLKQPFAVLAGKASSHCGAGCTLGDIVAELVSLGAPLALFGQRIFGSWLVDFAFAYAFGIAFQYFTIQPMQHVSPAAALKRALQADTLSLLAWQVGMYGWMALASFLLFQRELPKASPVFWWMMQIAMWFGFAFSYPVNRWLLRHGIKEAM